MNRIEIITVFVFSFVSFLFSVNCAYSKSYSISITTPANGTASNPVQVSGPTSATDFSGNLDQYSVRIDWGDGSSRTDLVQGGIHLILTQSGGKNFAGTYTTSTNLTHTYAAGSYIITVILCHSQCTGAEGATASASASITIQPPTCGISLSSNDLYFDNVNPGTDSLEQTLGVTNTGNFPAVVTVSGNDWDSGSNILSVSRTAFSTSSGNYDSKIQLSTSPQTLFTSLVPSSPTNSYWQFRALPTDPGGAYTQTITFTSSC